MVEKASTLSCSIFKKVINARDHGPHYQFYSDSPYLDPAVGLLIFPIAIRFYWPKTGCVPCWLERCLTMNWQMINSKKSVEESHKPGRSELALHD